MKFLTKTRVILVSALVVVLAVACGSSTEFTGFIQEQLEGGPAPSVVSSPAALGVLSALRPICEGAPSDMKDTPGAVLPSFFPKSDVDHFDLRGTVFVPAVPNTMKSHRALAELAGHADESMKLTDQDTSMQVKVTTLDSTHATGEVTNGYLVYHGGHSTGADVLQLPSEEGSESFYSFASAPTTPEVNYRVDLGANVAGVRLLSNQLEFLDTTGYPRLRMSPPVLRDSACKYVDAVVTVDGCAYDSSQVMPWEHPITAPGSTQCNVHVRWKNNDVKYPAVLDPTWRGTGSMGTARYGHVSITLPNNLVLIVGGQSAPAVSASLDTSETYDPRTAIFTATGSVIGGKRYFAAGTYMLDGLQKPLNKVLYAGGLNTSNVAVKNVDIYTYGVGWTSGPLMNWARSEFSLQTSFYSGSILAAAGDTGFAKLNTSEELLVGASSWSKFTTLPATSPARSFYAMAEVGLPYARKTLLIGGHDGIAASGKVDLYDFTTSTWTAGTALPAGQERALSVATSLSPGAAPYKVLLSGGTNTAGTNLANTYTYEYTSGLWTLAGALSYPRNRHGAVRMFGGEVLIAGGGDAGWGSATDKVEIWNPLINAWRNVDALAKVRYMPGIAVLNTGVVFVTGGYNGTSTVELTTELWDAPPVGAIVSNPPNAQVGSGQETMAAYAEGGKNWVVAYNFPYGGSGSSVQLWSFSNGEFPTTWTTGVCSTGLCMGNPDLVGVPVRHPSDWTAANGSTFQGPRGDPGLIAMHNPANNKGGTRLIQSSMTYTTATPTGVDVMVSLSEDSGITFGNATYVSSVMDPTLVDFPSISTHATVPYGTYIGWTTGSGGTLVKVDYDLSVPPVMTPSAPISIPTGVAGYRIAVGQATVCSGAVHEVVWVMFPTNSLSRCASVGNPYIYDVTWKLEMYDPLVGWAGPWFIDHDATHHSCVGSNMSIPAIGDAIAADPLSQIVAIGYTKSTPTGQRANIATVIPTCTGGVWTANVTHWQAGDPCYLNAKCAGGEYPDGGEHYGSGNLPDGGFAQQDDYETTVSMGYQSGVPRGFATWFSSRDSKDNTLSGIYSTYYVGTMYTWANPTMNPRVSFPAPGAWEGYGNLDVVPWPSFNSLTWDYQTTAVNANGTFLSVWSGDQRGGGGGGSMYSAASK